MYALFLSVFFMFVLKNRVYLRIKKECMYSLISINGEVIYRGYKVIGDNVCVWLKDDESE